MYMFKVRYPDHHNFHCVCEWCMQNCKGRFYSGTDWNMANWIASQENRMFEFEKEQDATWFALRWA